MARRFCQENLEILLQTPGINPETGRIRCGTVIEAP